MFKRVLTTGVAALSLGLASAPALSEEFSGVWSFGDSLSDTGNIFALTGTPPSPPYFDGRFSNGPLWVEYLAPLVGTSFTGGTNFALGGAESGTGQTGALTQIGGVAASGATIPSDALVTLWIGSNDYLNNATTVSPTVLVPQTVTNVATAVGTLDAIGARTILVNNLPDFGATPGGASTGLASSLRQLAAAHNGLLASTLNEQDRTLDAQIVIADIFALFDDLVADPSRYGFSNVTIPCLLPSGAATGACPTAAAADSALFWDAIHPTTAAHEAVARFANATLTQALDAPAALATSAYLGPVIAEGHRAAVATRMRSLRAANMLEASTLDTGVYGGGLYITGDRDESTSLAGFNYDYAGGLVGVDHRIARDLIVGAALSYGSGDATSSLVVTDVDAITAAIYASAKWGNLFMDVTGVASWEDLDVARSTLFAERPTTTGDTNGQTWVFNYEGGYHFAAGPRVKFGPVANVRLVSTDIDEYEESGSVLFDTRVSDRRASGWTGSVGLEVLGTFTGDDLAFSPYGRILYEGSLSDFEAETTLRTDLNQTFSAAGVTAASGQWMLNVGALVMAGPNVGLSFDYEGALDTSNGEEHRATMRAVYQF